MKEQEIEDLRKEILDLNDEDLINYVMSLKMEISVLKSDLHYANTELHILENEDPELEEKCLDCIIPNCKSMF